MNSQNRPGSPKICQLRILTGSLMVLTSVGAGPEGMSNFFIPTIQSVTMRARQSLWAVRDLVWVKVKRIVNLVTSERNTVKNPTFSRFNNYQAFYLEKWIQVLLKKLKARQSREKVLGYQRIGSGLIPGVSRNFGLPVDPAVIVMNEQMKRSNIRVGQISTFFLKPTQNVVFLWLNCMLNPNLKKNV